MTYRKRLLRCIPLACIFFLLQFKIFAQQDSIPKENIDTTKAGKTFIGKIMNTLSLGDTNKLNKPGDVVRNDEFYKKYEGYIIRRITINRLPFGIPFGDTSKKVVNTLTRWANTVHHITRNSVIKKNLFFSVNDTLLPYLMADNETYLRQLPFLQDVAINVSQVDSATHTVDIDVAVKDLFSLGGSVGSLGLKTTDIQVKEENVSGYGNSLAFNALYDERRRTNIGLGMEYTQRNIASSFINATIGYQSFNKNYNGLKEENYYYTRFVKNLVNRYMHWTYELDVSYHSTRNMYAPDSVYYPQLRYRYYNFDAWAGYNLHATKISTQNEGRKLRKFFALRLLDLQYQDIPSKFDTIYNWRYASLKGVLGSVSFYRQNFYKAKYVYGFGINEDIPEGVNFTLTAGYTNKENLGRPFIGINYQHSAFTLRNNYFAYTLRAEGYLNHRLEDVNLLGEIDYFDHLKSIGTRWKQRTFITFGFAQQINRVLNEPLYFDSKFGLREYGIGDDFGGSMRTTIKLQSVFFSPWSLASFKFAPVIFGNTGLFTPYHTPGAETNIYSTVGAGLRVRSESLTFGTFEFKGYYFLKKNFRGERYRFDISTNLTFKSNVRLVSRPDFIEIN